MSVCAYNIQRTQEVFMANYDAAQKNKRNSWYLLLAAVVVLLVLIAYLIGQLGGGLSLIHI